MGIPDLIDPRMLSQVGGVPPPLQDSITPVPLPTPPQASPMAAPPNVPPGMGLDVSRPAPPPQPGFAQILVRAIPMLLAGIAAKRGGTPAVSGLLGGYADALEKRRLLEEKQHEFDVQTAATEEERQMRRQEYQANRDARIGNYFTDLLGKIGSIDDPAQYAAVIQNADTAAQKAFGTPAGFISNQLAGAFDKTKAVTKAQKDAQARLALVRTQLGENFDDAVAANATITEPATGKKQSLRDLQALAGLDVTSPEGEPIGTTPKVTETESTFITRGIKAAQKAKGGPLDEAETNAKVAELRQQYAQAGRVIDPETARHNRAMEAAAARAEAAKNAPSKPIEVGTPDYKVAQDLAFGRMSPAFFRTLVAYTRDVEKKAAIYALAGEINPNFNQADFERGFKFINNAQTGRQLSSLDNALSGVPDLLAASDAADRSGATVLNRFTTPVRIGMGNQKFSNLNTARLAWADEVSGALGFGTASDMKLQLGLDLTDANLSPANFRAAIQNVVVPFLERKRASILNQASVYGGADNNSSVQPTGAQTGTGRQTGAGPNTGGPSTAGPKEGETQPITDPGYPPGAMKQFKGGHWVRIK